MVSTSCTVPAQRRGDWLCHCSSMRRSNRTGEEAAVPENADGVVAATPESAACSRTAAETTHRASKPAGTRNGAS